MAVVGRIEVSILLRFMILVTAVVPEIYGQTVKSLYVAPRKEKTTVHMFETTETRNLVSDSTGVWKSDALTGHSLYKRSAVLETKSNITTNVSFRLVSCLLCCVSVCVLQHLMCVLVLGCAILRI